MFSENTPATDETAKMEEKQNIIQLQIIGNSVTQPMTKEMMMWLIGLQTIFSYNLPRMPKNYLSQLLFDPLVENI